MTAALFCTLSFSLDSVLQNRVQFTFQLQISVKRVQRRCLAKPQLSQNSKIPNPEDNDEEEEDEGEEMKRL